MKIRALCPKSRKRHAVEKHNSINTFLLSILLLIKCKVLEMLSNLRVKYPGKPPESASMQSLSCLPEFPGGPSAHYLLSLGASLVLDVRTADSLTFRPETCTTVLLVLRPSALTWKFHNLLPISQALEHHWSQATIFPGSTACRWPTVRFPNFHNQVSQFL